MGASARSASTGSIPGVGALHRLLEDHVGLVEAGRRSVRRVVADLDGQGRTCRDRAAGCRRAGQRAGGHTGRGVGGGGRCRGLLGGRRVAEGERQHHTDQDHDGRAEHVPPGPRAPLPLGTELLAGHDGGWHLAAGGGAGTVAGTLSTGPRCGRVVVRHHGDASAMATGRGTLAKIPHRTCVRVYSAPVAPQSTAAMQSASHRRRGEPSPGRSPRDPSGGRASHPICTVGRVK